MTITQEVAEDGTEVLGFNFSSSEAQEYLAEHKGEIAKELDFTANDMEILEDILSNIREVDLKIASLEAEYQESNAISTQQYCDPYLEAEVQVSAYRVTAESATNGCSGRMSVVMGYARNVYRQDRYEKRQSGYLTGAAGVRSGARCQGFAMAVVQGYDGESDYGACVH